MPLLALAARFGLAAALVSGACAAQPPMAIEVESIRVPGVVIACSGRPMTPDDCQDRGDAAIARAGSTGLAIKRVEVSFKVEAGVCERMNVEVLAEAGATILSATGPCP